MEGRTMATNDEVQPLSLRSEGMPTMTIGRFVAPDEVSPLADDLGQRLDLGGTSGEAAVARFRRSALAAVHGRGGRRSPDPRKSLREAWRKFAQGEAARAKHWRAWKDGIEKRLSDSMRPEYRELYEKMLSLKPPTFVDSSDLEEFHTQCLRPSDHERIRRIFGEKIDKMLQHQASIDKDLQLRQEWLMKLQSDPHLHLTPGARESYEKSLSTMASMNLQERAAESLSSSDYDSVCRNIREKCEEIAQIEASLAKLSQKRQAFFMKRLSDPNLHLTPETRASYERELSLIASNNMSTNVWEIGC